MDNIDKFKKELHNLVKSSIKLQDDIINQINTEVYKNAPIVVIRRLRGELRQVGEKYNKPHGNKDFDDILTAIIVIEELYPEVKNNS